MLPDYEYFSRFLSYDHNTGELTWKARPVDMFNRPQDQKTWNKRFSGKKASREIIQRSYKRKDLFRSIVCVEYKNYLAHRVCLVLSGHRPEDIEDKIVDHINHDPSDNRLCNLRLTTASGNQRNRRRHPACKAGVAGVRFRDSGKKKWKCYIIDSTGKRRDYSFFTLFDAACARKRMELDNGYHHNHGK